MTSSQLRLPGLEPPRQVRPEKTRPAPAFWIHRLRILRELASGPENLVRPDIELRRGFNIVWAPPQSATDNALFRDGVTGHTAGKSTFCRLLRHVLGERGFAPESVKRRIRTKLATAWIVAEVVIADVTWVVARPLGIRKESFCLRGASLDDAAVATERLDYQVFLQALAEATTGQLVAARFPASDEPVEWEHMLPWLARDQECRFADFLEWRHSSSGSEAPALNVDERQFIVRSVLGLISEDERVEQRRNAQLVAERKDATRNEPLLRHQAEIDRTRLLKALKKELPLSSTPMFGDTARSELARRREDLEAREKALADSDRRDVLRVALESANRNAGALKQSLEDAESRLALVQASAASLAGSQQSSLFGALAPPRDFCNVPMRLALEKGCPLAGDRPTDIAARRSERTAAQELEAERQLAESIAREVDRIQDALQTANTAIDTARRGYLLSSTSYAEAQSRLQRERSFLANVEQLIETAEAAAREANAKAEAIAELGREIDDSYERQDKLREAQHAAITRFSARFDYIVRAVLGDRVTGRVDTSGRSLALTVEEHGERESAAIATVKLLAFDLAALVTSIEGDGTFPRFLIHDGPREADMAPNVYERLFLLAHELEKCFEAEPSFQYILTTTTQPPDTFLDARWLRLKLAGIPADDRLLRCDL